MEVTDSEDTQLRAANGGNLKTAQLRPTVAQIRGRRTHALISAAAMAALLFIGMDVRNSFGASAEVIVNPYYEKRAPMPFDGPSEGTLSIRPATGYKLHDSGVTLEDFNLWTKDEENSNDYKHIFLMATAYTSQGFVHVDGDLEPESKPGKGEGTIEYPPFHVSVPAVKIDWTGPGAPKDAIEKAEKAVWLTCKTNQSFTIDAPHETQDDMPAYGDKDDNEQKDKWFANQSLSWDTNRIDVLTNGFLVVESPLFIPREWWTGAPRPKPTGYVEKGDLPKFTASLSTNSPPTTDVMEIRLDRYSTFGDLNYSEGALSDVYDIIKCKALVVELSIDSLNRVGTGAPLRDAEEKAAKLTSGKIIHMNDMDQDGDFIPDFLDGFGAVSDPKLTDDESGIIEKSDEAFVQLRLYIFPPPEDVSKIKFIYDCGLNNQADPREIMKKQLTLAQAAQIQTNSIVENPWKSGIRIWTKPSKESRIPFSIDETNDSGVKGDFVPSSKINKNLYLSCENLPLGGPATLYIEGIGTSDSWLEDLTVEYYPDGEKEADGKTNTHEDDSVKYSVVRCVYWMCAFRPYVAERDNPWGSVINRWVFNTSYVSPRTMVTDYARGIMAPDDINKYHGKAAFMGHGFARIEVRMPEWPKNEGIIWTGHTGMGDKNTVSYDTYSSIISGTTYWKTYNDGVEDNPEKLSGYWEYFIGSPGKLLLSPSGKKRLIAGIESRILPDTFGYLNEYRKDKHFFQNYGLDTTIKTDPASTKEIPRCGCATYIALLTQYAGIADVSSWVIKREMPVIPITTVPISRFTVLAKFNIALITFLMNDVTAEFCAHPDSLTWGGATAKSLKFSDPSLLAKWIDKMNNVNPLNKSDRTEQKVLLFYDVPEKNDLKDDWDR